MSDGCNQKAVAVWTTEANPKEEWFTCEPCQETDFGGWPNSSDSEEDSLGSADKYIDQQKTCRRALRRHAKNNTKLALTTKAPRNEQIGDEIYDELTRFVEETAKSQNQIAISISEPTMTINEESQRKKSLLTPEELIRSWTLRRIQRDRTWVYVDKDYPNIYRKYCTVVACAKETNDIATDDENMVDNKRIILWDKQASINMLKCILCLLDNNDKKWAVAMREWEDRKETNIARNAFTRLMALSKVVYQINHWHNSANDPKDLLNLCQRFSTRWRKVLALPDELIGQDSDGQRGLHVFMKQMENNWNESVLNKKLKGRFQFQFQGTINGFT